MALQDSGVEELRPSGSQAPLGSQIPPASASGFGSPIPTVAVHQNVGFRAAMHDIFGNKTIAWSIKEQIDNCLSKAEPVELPPDVAPWNATHVRLRLETITEGTYLIISDNGRGLTWEELEEGFAGIGHTKEYMPQLAQQKGISMFGTGSKTGDASLATDILYFTRHKNLELTYIARTGKDLSACTSSSKLRFDAIPVTNEWLNNLASQVTDQDIIKTEDDPIVKKASEELFYPNIFPLLKHAAFNLSRTTGFLRMLRLRENIAAALQVPNIGMQYKCYRKEDKQQRVIDMSDTDSDELPKRANGRSLRPTPKKGKNSKNKAPPDDAVIDIADMLARNFLFPPSVVRDDDGIEDESPGGQALLEEQQRIVRGLVEPDYYMHPVHMHEYTPEIDIQNEMVDWGKNSLLKHLGNFHSEILEVQGNPARYGNGTLDDPAARVVVTYLTDKPFEQKGEKNKKWPGRTDQNARHCGVAVYLGCRRICDPELVDGNWTLGGVADEYMEFADAVTGWSLTHSTHQNVSIGYKKFLGDELTAKMKKYEKEEVFKGSNSHFMAFHGVHAAIVIPPGMLEVKDDKQGFVETKHAKALMVDCLRKALEWMVDNPPLPLQPLLQGYINREEDKRRQAAQEAQEKIRQAAMRAEEQQRLKEQQRIAKAQAAAAAAAAKAQAAAAAAAAKTQAQSAAAAAADRAKSKAAAVVAHAANAQKRAAVEAKKTSGLADLADVAELVQAEGTEILNIDENDSEEDAMYPAKKRTKTQNGPETNGVFKVPALARAAAAKTASPAVNGNVVHEAPVPPLPTPPPVQAPLPPVQASLPPMPPPPSPQSNGNQTRRFQLKTLLSKLRKRIELGQQLGLQSLDELMNNMKESDSRASITIDNPSNWMK